MEITGYSPNRPSMQGSTALGIEDGEPPQPAFTAGDIDPRSTLESCREQNLLYERHGALHVITPFGQTFDPLRKTIVAVIGVHPNENQPCIRNGQFVMDETDNYRFKNTYLQALNELIKEGSLDANVVFVTDIFEGIIPEGKRLNQINIDNHKAGIIDGNRVSTVDLRRRLDPSLSNVDAHRVGSIPQLDDFIVHTQPEEQQLMDLEATYRLAQQRIFDVVKFIREDLACEDPTVVIPHKDKNDKLSIDEIDPNSALYNYFHSLGIDPAYFLQLNAEYLKQINAKYPKMKIATPEYIRDQEPPIKEIPKTNIVQDGTVVLSQLVDDHSAENLVTLTVAPVTVAQELIDGLNPAVEVDLIKMFYTNVLLPIADKIKHEEIKTKQAVMEIMAAGIIINRQSTIPVH